MFTNLISRIHNCLQEDDILQASVDSVKQTLGCDRAVIYSLKPQTLGKIVAEAVGVEFPKTIETTIYDPCFMARHLDSYRQGRISAIENIQEAKVTPCHVETLTRLGVKANLVVPLRLPDDELYGLLIAHQCYQPRAWSESEITLLSQMAAQIGWALNNALRWSEYQKVQSSLEREKYYHDALATATQKIHSGHTRIEVLQAATAQVQSVLKCDRSIVYIATAPNQGRIVAESVLSPLSPIRESTLELPYFEYRYIDEYQQARIQAIDNIHEADLSSSAIENLTRIAVKSNIIVPIINERNELFGVLVAHQCFNYRAWQDMEIEWLKQIGIQTGFAITKAQLQEEITAMKISLKRASLVKETIANADSKIQQVKQSLHDSVQTSDETKHLMRLLSREVITLTDKLSVEDINLARIITKKLQANTETATAVTNSLQDKMTELSTVIDSGVQAYKSRPNN
jgi:GAF domain-containing protein